MRTHTLTLRKRENDSSYIKLLAQIKTISWLQHEISSGRIIPQVCRGGACPSRRPDCVHSVEHRQPRTIPRPALPHTRLMNALFVLRPAKLWAFNIGHPCPSLAKGELLLLSQAQPTIEGSPPRLSSLPQTPPTPHYPSPRTTQNPNLSPAAVTTIIHHSLFIIH